MASKFFRFFHKKRKRRLSEEIISRKLPKNTVVDSSNFSAKENIFILYTKNALKI